MSTKKFKLLAGKPLSYNNWCDLDRLLHTMTHIAATFDLNYKHVDFIALGAKHGNVCGAAIKSHPSVAITKMVVGDLQALFGGLVMVNFPVDEKIAELLLTHKAEGRRLLDGIIAPKFSSKAIKMLERKGDKCRVIVNPALGKLSQKSLDKSKIIRPLRGGYLEQPSYSYLLDLKDPDLKRYGDAGLAKEYDMLLAKAICDTSNSNTITIVSEGQLIGNGVGQQSRVSGAELALGLADKNGHGLNDSVAASDSFFPFKDGPEVLVESGVRTIISTSGSVKDSEVIDFCLKADVALYLIPDKKGRGFFNH